MTDEEEYEQFLTRIENAMIRASDIWNDDVAFEAIVLRFIEHYSELDSAIDAAREEDEYNDEKPIWFRWDSESLSLVRDNPEAS